MGNLFSARSVTTLFTVFLALTLLASVTAKPIVKAVTSAPIIPTTSIPLVSSSVVSTSLTPSASNNAPFFTTSSASLPTTSTDDSLDDDSTTDVTSSFPTDSASILPASVTSNLTTNTTTATSTPAASSSAPGLPVKTIAIVCVLVAIVVGAFSFCFIMRIHNKRKQALAEKSGRRVTRYFQRPDSIFARPSSLFRPRSVAESTTNTPPPRPRMSMFRGDEGTRGGRFSVWLGGRDASGSRNSFGKFGNGSKQSLGANGSKYSLSQKSAHHDQDTLAPPMPGFVAESMQDKKSRHPPPLYDKF